MIISALNGSSSRNTHNAAAAMKIMMYLRSPRGLRSVLLSGFDNVSVMSCSFSLFIGVFKKVVSGYSVDSHVFVASVGGADKRAAAVI